jgi:dTDP-4-amino-4,6-dideoxygalactose transaminase
VPPKADPVWHLFVVRHPQRDALAALLRASGVETLIHYPVPVHLQDAYAGQPAATKRLPIAETLANQVLSLPMGPTLSDDQQQRVIDAVCKACETLALSHMGA